MTLHEAMLGAGLESPYGEWLDKWTESDDDRDRGPRVTTKVPCGDYFHLRDEALRAHATQVDPDGFWFRVPMEIQQAAWPTEDYELARSLGRHRRCPRTTCSPASARRSARRSRRTGPDLRFEPAHAPPTAWA